MKKVNQILLAVSAAVLFSGISVANANETNEHAGHDMSSMDMNHMEESTVGKSGKGLTVAKTYNVSLLDTMRFEFDKQPDLKDGDVVKFVVTNKGKIPHEFSIGSSAEQDAHREMMKSMPGMHHESDNAISVAPGATAPLIWQFSGKGAVVFACNVAGHFEAGMKHSTNLK